MLSCYGWYGILLLALLLFTFFSQLYYHLFQWGALSSYRLSKRDKLRETPVKVSVIVPLFFEDYDWIDSTLRSLLGQKYEEDFQIVVVYVGSDTDFYEDLCKLRGAYPHLSVTRIFLGEYPVSRKMAINVGIKAASFDYIIMTSADATPSSERWLKLMATGFCYSDIVLGYSAVERTSGPKNLFARKYQFMQSLPWLSSAIRGKLFGASKTNFGFAKELYFKAKGFNHLNMNAGEDDLFLQQIASGQAASIVLSPNAICKERFWRDIRWWTNRIHNLGVTFRYYPEWAKRRIQTEPVSRIAFFATASAACLFMPYEIKIAACAMLVLRYLLCTLSLLRIANRIGDKHLCLYDIVFDIFYPVIYFTMALTQRKKQENEWR